MAMDNLYTYLYPRAAPQQFFALKQRPQISGSMCKTEIRNCKFWTWEDETKTCHFKSSDSGYEQRNGSVSGDACCPKVAAGVCCPYVEVDSPTPVVVVVDEPSQ